ncbi:MAG: hypothetical protein Q7W13_13025 [Bacteroidia bacterium]|nr:hypothetical protein [Bacteroidia bacterium]
MKHLTLLNFFLCFNGLVLHFIYSVIKQKKQDLKFSMGFYIQDNILQSIATIIAAISSLLMADDIARILHIITVDGSPFYSVHSFISGLIPMFFINKIMKLFKATPEV